jgi:hypothetical protein
MLCPPPDDLPCDQDTLRAIVQAATESGNPGLLAGLWEAWSCSHPPAAPRCRELLGSAASLLLATAAADPTSSPGSLAFIETLEASPAALATCLAELEARAGAGPDLLPTTAHRSWVLRWIMLSGRCSSRAIVQELELHDDLGYCARSVERVLDVSCEEGQSPLQEAALELCRCLPPEHLWSHLQALFARHPDAEVSIPLHKALVTTLVARGAGATALAGLAAYRRDWHPSLQALLAQLAGRLRTRRRAPFRNVILDITDSLSLRYLAPRSRTEQQHLRSILPAALSQVGGIASCHDEVYTRFLAWRDQEPILASNLAYGSASYLRSVAAGRTGTVTEAEEQQLAEVMAWAITGTGNDGEPDLHLVLDLISAAAETRSVTLLERLDACKHLQQALGAQVRPLGMPRFEETEPGRWLLEHCH